MRVLIVDDYLDLNEATSELLSRMGHECRAATCAVDALVAANAFVPELAILDIGLPDLSGYDLLRQLRVRFAGHLPYLVAFTGSTDVRKKAFEVGFDYCLLKPARCEELSVVVELAKQRGQNS